MIRPQSVTQLSKSEGQHVICQCGEQFKASSDVAHATCPKCHEDVNWELRK